MPSGEEVMWVLQCAGAMEAEGIGSVELFDGF